MQSEQLELQEHFGKIDADRLYGNNKAENLFQEILRLHYYRVHPAAANEPGRVSAGIYRADGGTSRSDRRIFHFKQVCGTVP